MAPKKAVIKGAPKGKAAPPAPAAKKAADKKGAPAKRGAAKDEEAEERSPPRRVTGRREESDRESPAVAAARAMRVASPSGAGSSPAQSASAPSPQQTLARRPVPGRLRVEFQAPEGSGLVALEQGLVRLRRNSQLCDLTIISGFGRIPAHRTVLAAHSEKLAQRLQGAQGELDLQPASHEAVDLVVRWLYGEVSTANFQPSTSKVNEEVLKISSEFDLPLLAELCAARLAQDVDTSNVVASVRLCEEYGLPKLRAALVTAVVEDPMALDAVAKDGQTLSHPALMRELLASIASQVA